MDRQPLEALAHATPAEHELAERLALLSATLGRAPEVVAIVVLGSVARGEAVSAVVDGRWELFSDIELMAVTDRRLPPRRRAQLAASAEQLVDGFGFRSRHVHVDLAFRERRRLGSLPPIIFTYELRARGRILWGKDVLPEVRRVSLGNLDRRNAHEILVKRLWHLAAALPTAWVQGALLDELAARDLGVALWRQPLDLTTALLPDAGVLLPTYHERVDRWSSEPSLPFRPAIDAALGQDSGAWLTEILARRSRADASPDPLRDYARAARALMGGLAWLAGSSDEALGPALVAQSRQLFNDWPIAPGEWLALARQAYDIARSGAPSAATAWLAPGRKGRLAAGLVALHAALMDQHTGRPEQAARQLTLARRQGWRLAGLAGASPRGSETDENFVSAWLSARALLGRAFWRLARRGEASAWQAIAAEVGGPAEGPAAWPL